MGISRRSYAAQRGVSETAVRKAIATGRITTLPDGTIDPARADAEWTAQTDPSKQRGASANAPKLKPVPDTALSAVGDTLREQGLAPPVTGGGTTFLQAKTANEVLKARGAPS